MNDGDRSEVDDGAAARLADCGHDVLGDQGRSHDVDVEHGPPFLGSRVDAPKDEDRRVVHQNVDCTEGRDSLRRHSLQPRFVGHVGLHEKGSAARLLDSLGGVAAGRFVSFGDHDGRPLFGEELGSCAADPRTAPVMTATFPGNRFMAVSSLDPGGSGIGGPERLSLKSRGVARWLIRTK